MRSAAAVGLLLALGVWFGPSCGGSEERLRGVVLVVLDTVRADHLGCYGYPRPTSPRLDALAREGVRFEQVIAPAPWTLPSVAALLSGEHPERAYTSEGLRSSVVEALRDAGVRTAAITEGGYVSRHFGFDRGFDSWEEEEGAVRLPRPGESLEEPAPGGAERTFARALEWLEEVGDERFFLFVHTYEPHAPYTHGELARELDEGRVGPVFTLTHVEALRDGRITLAPQEVEYVTALYDGDIASADRHVGKLLDALDDLGLAGEVAVVVTSDHGEDLGERYPRNRFDHGHALLDDQVRVPLILRDPTRRVAGGVVEPQVRLFDVLPTVAELLEVPLPTELDGRSLVPLLDGREDAERIAVLGNTKAGPLRIGVRALGVKYVRSVEDASSDEPLVPEPPERQLYQLAVDPNEQRNLAGERPDAVEALERLMLERLPRSGGAPVAPNLSEDADPRLLERLRSLGYVR